MASEQAQAKLDDRVAHGIEGGLRQLGRRLDVSSQRYIEGWKPSSQDGIEVLIDLPCPVH